jgi:hypothetical protein
MKRYLVLVILMASLICAGCSTSDHQKAAVTLPQTNIPVPASVPATTVPATILTVPKTADVTQSLTPTPQQTPALISDSAIKARIQDAKNTLEMLKNSDMADTKVSEPTPPDYCEIKISKELGYLIDINTGEVSFVKGDYGKIALDRFQRNMTRGHTYIILHTHARDWVICQGSGSMGLNTFSLEDLAVPSGLTTQGYHIQKMIVVSDKMYEVDPKTPDSWKTMEEVNRSVHHIEQSMETTFHYTFNDPETGTKTWYDVDNLMPLLTRELNYTYRVNNNLIL